MYATSSDSPMPPSGAEVAPFIPYREHRWKGSLQQLIEVRRQAGVAQDRFCAVHYRDLVSDPLAVVRRIYEYFGLPLSDQTETSMRHFCEHNPQNKNGAHQYSLEQFGFSPEFERKRFQFYTDYFGAWDEYVAQTPAVASMEVSREFRYGCEGDSHTDG